MTRSTKVLALVCAGTFLTALDVTIVTVAYQSIRVALDDSPYLPWILSGYNIAFAAGLLTAGRMADSFGRKRAFLTGIAIFSVSSALCGLAPSVGFLIAARLVQAVGAALIVPSAQALILPEFPVERRAGAVGITAAVGGLGAATGPVIGGLVVDLIGWRWIFLINVPICAATIVIGRRLLREARDPASAGRRPDFVGAFLALASVALLTLALVESERWGFRSVRFVAVVVSAVVLGVIFVRRTRHHPVPTLDLGLFRLTFVVGANVAGVLYAAGFYAFNFIMVQWLREVWGYEAWRAGLAALATPGLSMLVSPFGGRLAQRFGHGRVATPGLVLFGLASLALSRFVDVSPANYWSGFFPLLALVGVAIGFTVGVLSSAAAAYLPPGRLAMGSALYATGRQVGGALGLAAVAAIAAAAPTVPDGFRWAWRYVFVVMVAAAIAMAALFRRPTPAELAAAEL